MIEKGKILIADEGYILTDGESYSSIVDLGNGKYKQDYHEITEEEYAKILAEEEENNGF